MMSIGIIYVNEKMPKPLIQPIYQTSNFEIEDDRAWSYSRSANPTRTALEFEIANLENAKHGMVFATGLAAVDAVIRLFKAGDEILSCQDLYGGSYRLFVKVHADKTFTFLGAEDVINLNDKIKAIFIESPTNPTLQQTDIRLMATKAHEHGWLLIVDNTLASPYYQNPLDLGADIVVHSVSKYINGHGDVVMGAVCVNDDKLYERLGFIQRICGAIPGPQDCWLVSRGLKTLGLRMERITQSAKDVCRSLSNNPNVAQLNYPGFSGVISFSLKEDTEQEALRICKSTKLFKFAVSLGGTQSLITHCATTNNAIMEADYRRKIGIPDSLIRLSIGLEDPKDLIEDLNNVL